MLVHSPPPCSSLGVRIMDASGADDAGRARHANAEAYQLLDVHPDNAYDRHEMVANDR
jgi:hypothetical protein